MGKTMMQHKIYAYISDGAVEEEISQGVGRIAGTLGLSNLIMFYDSNDIQLSTELQSAKWDEEARLWVLQLQSVADSAPAGAPVLAAPAATADARQ